MSRIAIATSRFAQPGVRGGLEVHEDVESPLVVEELRACGVEARIEAWDDEGVDWESYDLVVIRSTWGYARCATNSSPGPARDLAWSIPTTWSNTAPTSTTLEISPIRDYLHRIDVLRGG